MHGKTDLEKPDLASSVNTIYIIALFGFAVEVLN
jgi:hypothetical protein